jgi:dethiobiotin synthetase
MEVSSQLEATTTLPSGEDPSEVIVEGAVGLRVRLNETKIRYLNFRNKEKR